MEVMMFYTCFVLGKEVRIIGVELYFLEEKEKVFNLVNIQVEVFGDLF